MTYLTVKYIKGNPYLYEVRSVREGDRVRQVFVRYLGRADTAEGIERRTTFSREEAVGVKPRRAVSPVVAEPEAVTPEVTPPISEGITLYHGTKHGFEEFSESKLGQVTGAPSAKEGFFFTDKREIAEGYASELGSAELNALETDMNRLERKAQRSGLSSDWEKHQEALEKYEHVALSEEEKEFTGDVKEVTLDIKNPLVKDFGGKAFQEGQAVELMVQAKEGGYDGVIFKNVADSVNTPIEDRGIRPDREVSNIYAVFDKQQIKGKLAVTPEVTPPVTEGIAPEVGVGEIRIIDISPNKETVIQDAISRLKDKGFVPQTASVSIDATLSETVRGKQIGETKGIVFRSEGDITPFLVEHELLHDIVAQIRKDKGDDFLADYAQYAGFTSEGLAEAIKGEATVRTPVTEDLVRNMQVYLSHPEELPSSMRSFFDSLSKAKKVTPPVSEGIAPEVTPPETGTYRVYHYYPDEIKKTDFIDIKGKTEALEHIRKSRTAQAIWEMKGGKRVGEINRRTGEYLFPATIAQPIVAPEAVTPEVTPPVTLEVTIPRQAELTGLERKVQELYGDNIKFIRYNEGVAGTPWGHSGTTVDGTPFISYSSESPHLIPNIIAHELAHLQGTKAEMEAELSIGHKREWYQRYVEISKDLGITPETFESIQERKETRLVTASKAEAEEISKRIGWEDTLVALPKAEVTPTPTPEEPERVKPEPTTIKKEASEETLE